MIQFKCSGVIWALVVVVVNVKTLLLSVASAWTFIASVMQRVDTVIVSGFILWFTLRCCQYLRPYDVKWYDEQWIGKDLEGSGSGLIEVLSQYFPGYLKENNKEPQSRWSVSRPRFKPSAWSLERYSYTNMLSLPVDGNTYWRVLSSGI
jgi:hypothetical protein